MLLKKKVLLRCYHIVVKEGRRRRYIGFKIKFQDEKVDHVEKPDMISKIREQSLTLFDKNCNSMGVYLIRFNGEQGIVKCNHIEKENTIKLLKSINEISSNIVEIETLGTSGTIKSLIKKHMSQ